ncbi:MAG: DnaJ domain-containing protein [Bacteroidota bacterium]
MFQDYYQILQVNPSANAEDIKRAYRRLAREFHPDSSDHPQAHERFSRINTAYQTLSDPLKKHTYDHQYHRYQAGDRTAFERKMPRPKPPSPFDPQEQDPEELARQYRAAKIRQRTKRQKEFVRYRPAIFVAFGLALLFGLTMVADRVMVQQTEASQILNIEVILTPTGREQCLVHTGAFSVQLPCEKAALLGKGDYIGLSVTPLYQVPVRLKIWRDSWPYVTALDGKRQLLAPNQNLTARPGIYNLFIFFPLLLLGSSLIGLFLWQKPELAFKFGLLSIGLIPFNLFFLWLS